MIDIVTWTSVEANTAVICGQRLLWHKLQLHEIVAKRD